VSCDNTTTVVTGCEPPSQLGPEYIPWQCNGPQGNVLTSAEMLETLPVGSSCYLRCDSWKTAAGSQGYLESTCYSDGEWTATVPHNDDGELKTPGGPYPLPTYNESDVPAPLKCGCSPLHITWPPEAMDGDENYYFYDPNDEAGTDFVCKIPAVRVNGAYVVQEDNDCILYCDSHLTTAVKCNDGVWTGEPKLGFWCYSEPAVGISGNIGSIDLTPNGDLAIIVLGGEGPDGLLDTVDVLTTEQGWCPEDKVKIPKLPMAAGNLTAHYGSTGFLVVCGFPGVHACFHISPAIGHMEWQPLIDHASFDVGLSELEYISSTDSHMRQGVTGLFRRKNDSSFKLLWNVIQEMAGENRMTGWRDNYDADGADDVQYPPLSGDPFAACLATFVMPNGMPCTKVLSGGFLDGETSNDMSLWFTTCIGSENNYTWIPYEPGSLVPRSYHHCRNFAWNDTKGLLLVGGWESKLGQSLSSMEFLEFEMDNSFQQSTFLPEMNFGRHSFGLAHFNAPSADGDLNKNHPEYMVALGGVGDDGEILSSVEIFADPDQFPYTPTWFLKHNWEMKIGRKGFAAVANGVGSLVNRTDFCHSF